MDKIKDGVRETIDHWYKDTPHDVIHFWEQDDTWFVIIRYQPLRSRLYPDRVQIKLDFARIFPSFRMEGTYHISIDKTVNV